MAFDTRVHLTGSTRTQMPGSQLIGTVEASESVHVTVVLRHKGGAPNIAGGKHLSRDIFAEKHGADPEAMAAIEGFARQAGLEVVESSARKRRVKLTGTAEAMTKAFNAQMSCYQIESTGDSFRGRTGTLTIPADLEPFIIALLGFDTRPVAVPHFRYQSAQDQAAQAAAATSFTPPQVAALYTYPTGVDGTGQTIGIIELGGGYQDADLAAYFSSLGVNAPSVSAIPVDGGANTPGGNADGEVMLDIEVAGAIAPGAKIAVYFAPNTDQGFIDAITDAAHDTTHQPSVISVSWGGPEDSWTPQSQTAMNAALQDAAALGVTVTAAAGDRGSTDGVGDNQLHVDFPASSPYVLACGGTTLQGSGSTISSETVWNEIANGAGATGGGVSKMFALPSYQSSANVPPNPTTQFVGRGVPDVAGDADPTTGYQVRVDGQNVVVGGTSAVAPLIAGLLALINQKLGKPVGFLNPAIYALSSSPFNDITSGNNDDSGLGYYNAGAGWDPCTGLGTPNGAALLSALQSTSGAASGS